MTAALNGPRAGGVWGRKRPSALPVVSGLLLVLSCSSPTLPRASSPERPPVRAAADAFVMGLVRPWPPDSPRLALVVTGTGSERVSSYDNALLTLYLLRHGRRDLAAKVLEALAELQQPDGAVPFSFTWPGPDAGAVYVRTGAMAWVGYAATAYLDAERGGPAREAITVMAHRIANYLLVHQEPTSKDGRSDLVLGGNGSYRLKVVRGHLSETFFPGEVPWASTEHNIDSFFFLRDFGALTGESRFTDAARRVGAALSARGWMPAAGQLARGFEEDAIDPAFALDCASWGSLFLHAAGDDLRAETSWASAEGRYLARLADRGAAGHKPYAHGPVIENIELAAYFSAQLPTNNWDALNAVWVEGSAGVALAALRVGRRARSQEILDHLEPLRAENGGLPGFTTRIPYEFDTESNLAGTLWSELVRDELALPQGRELLWRR